MASPDDLPWPELGNVSRGATRGNQGQKGVLGPPDRDGRCVLQLRVQPGVLAVRLNRQASDWYRTLDNEVNRALKLTKTYWRKARRRQDYDARADQDHMELHEWLQQLKDKTMSHLELLMQKGDIVGPPYVMPDDVELTFLRKFIERQASGIPHNPRLRNGNEAAYSYHDPSAGSASPEASDGYIDQGHAVAGGSNNTLISSSRTSGSPTLRSREALTQEASTSNQTLQISRAALSRAQKDTQDAFLRYTACLDAERQARQSVAALERRRDDVMNALIAMNQAPVEQQPSRQSSVSVDDHQSATRYHVENSADIKPRHPIKPMDSWTEATTDPQAVYSAETVAHLESMAQAQDRSMNQQRKHSRTWEAPPQQLPDGQYACEDMSSLPPRKRMHHMMPGYDVLSNPVLQSQSMTSQNMSLQS